MMTATTDYLARLDVALRDVPHGIAAEIRSGISEELSSLDPDAAAQRIAQLGDPHEIAREAMDAGGFTPTATAASPRAVPPVPTTSTRGFAIVAALALSFGGIVVPVLGWVIGAILVSLSSMWRTWEKVVAIVVPLGFAALTAAASLAVWTVTDESTGVAVVAVNGDGGMEIGADPLVPTAYDMVFSSIGVMGLLLIPASGLWLLWRMRGRVAA